MKSCCVFVLLSIGCIGWVHAEIYKSVDAEGHVTYSSVPTKGAKKLGLEPLAPPTARASRAPTPHSPHASKNPSPSDFPRVDSSTQKSRDSVRHKILADELAAEEKLLAEARVSLKQGEAKPDGKLRALQEEVTLHEKNVSALKTELSNIR